jgi:ABC-type molybdate transport system ATPase subunit
MRIVALLAVYNEARFIGPCLEHLFRQGLQAYLIDNCSTDETVALAEPYLGRGLRGIETLPRNGTSDLGGRLRRKEQLATQLNADWFVHMDADEIRVPPHSYRTMAEAFGAGFHPELTGRENAIINGVMFGLSKAEIKAKLDAIIDFSELQEYIDDPVRIYSNGMYMRLGFSVAVHVDPEILLIDEILAVGDVAFKRKCMDRMNGLRKRGTTVVFVSHDVVTVRSLCDEAAWLHEGVLRMSGRTADVVGAYLKEMR